MPIISPTAISPHRIGKKFNWSSYWTTRTPTGLVLTALSPTSLRAAWTNTGIGFDGHSVELSTDGVTFAEEDTVLIGTNTLDITGLISGTLYYVRVRAYKVAAGVTQYSEYCDIVSQSSDYLPTDIATLWRWYDASQLTGLSNGADVASFTDLSGNNGHLTQGSADLRPHYTTNVQNGLPSVRTDGSNDWMRVLTTAWTQPKTIFLVASRVSGTGVRLLDGQSPTPTLQLNGEPPTKLYCNYGTALTTNSFTGLANGTAFILSTIANGASSYIAKNGGFSKSGNGGTTAGDRIHIGTDTTGANPINADYFEMVYFDSALDATNIRRMETYLGHKWGIELVPI